MAAGRKETIELLTKYVTENQNKLYRLAYSYVKEEQLALDVIQDSIVKALANLSNLKKVEYLTTWFYRILIHEALNSLKKNKIRKEVMLKDYEWEEASKEQLEAVDVYQKIDCLNVKLKTVIFLRFYEDRKLEEIAEITKTNINTVKSRLYKALRELKKMLKEGKKGEEIKKSKTSL